MSYFEPEFAGVIGRTWQDSEPWWPPEPSPPEGAPNIVFIVLDDVGFAQLGCFGSDIETPHMDRLAADGLRYNNFHTTTLCSPTRACLLTGRNHHSVGMATIAEGANGFPNSRGRVSKQAGLLPEVLHAHGYNCFAVGKWHLVSADQQTMAGPFDHWPLGRGFDRYYGFLGGDNNQWHPDLIHDNHRVDPPASPEDGYHLSADIVDKAIEFVRDQQSAAPRKPFFCYVAFGAGHAPHHTPPEYIERYRGRYDRGWDRVREEWFARQKELGIAPANAELAPRDEVVKAWDDFSDDARRLYARMMEVYAGFLTHTDDQIGRLIGFLDEIGRLDDTLVVLISDNGASAEGGDHGLVSEWTFFNGIDVTVDDNLARIDELGGPTTYNHYPIGWAQAGNTPFQWYKRWVHAGGVRDPLVVRWPARIRDRGAVRSQYHHVVDVVPTVLEVVGVEAPAVLDGVPQLPIAGTSFAYTFDDADSPGRKPVQHYEMFGNRAVWAGGWKAVAAHQRDVHYVFPHPFEEDRWELYHLDEDFSELRDLADQHPEKVAELVERWWVEAGKHNVLPLDDRGAFRAQWPQERTVFTYYPGMAGIHPMVAGRTFNRNHTITAEVERPDASAEGVLLALGGRFAGWTLYVKDNRLVYEYNFVELERYAVTSTREVPVGASTLQMRFDLTGRRQGKATLLIDGAVAGEGTISRMCGVTGLEPLDCGQDTQTPVSPAYESPFRFSGDLRRVVLEVRGKEVADERAETTAALTQQ
ncbi:MAG: arylsulfatase [Acidimicrobiia bacterium]